MHGLKSTLVIRTVRDGDCCIAVQCSVASDQGLIALNTATLHNFDDDIPQDSKVFCSAQFIALITDLPLFLY